MPHDPSVAEQRAGDVLARYRPAIERGLRDALDLPGVDHVRYMRYHLGWEDSKGRSIETAAGKLLRPALCLLACEAARGRAETAMPAAVAIELLHNFTLIHDDIEDGSETRHGRATLWSVVGVAQAINTGDGMFVLAQRALLGLRSTGVPPPRILDALEVLHDASVELCEGQYLDLAFEQGSVVPRAAYDRMIAGKSAALIAAAMALGAIAAGSESGAVAAFRQAGESLGMAFQVQDDVLGVWGEPALTGKPVADDIRARKKSFPVIYAHDALPPDERAELARIYARETLTEDDVERVLALFDAAGARDAATAEARRLAAEATGALVALDLSDERRADLDAVAGFAVSRTF
jgi:geranylgeranyl diphosphate synthase type I